MSCQQAGRVRTPKPWPLPAAPATLARLRELGVSDAMLRTQLDSGRLLRLRSGVYLASESWPSDPREQHAMLARAELATQPDAVVSHGSAALLWDLPTPGFGGWDEAPVSITRAEGRHRTRTGAVHHLAPLPAHHVTREPFGYPVTTPARTAADLAGGLPLPESLVLLDAAARRLCSSFVAGARRATYADPRLVEASRELLREAAIARHRNLRLAIELVDPGRESAAESLSAGHFHLAGLPAPLFQPPIPTPFGTVFPDCLWVKPGLIGECDGAVKYQQSEAYVKEKEREQILRDLGFDVVRWLAAEIMTKPRVVTQRVERALAECQNRAPVEIRPFW